MALLLSSVVSDDIDLVHGIVVVVVVVDDIAVGISDGGDSSIVSGVGVDVGVGVGGCGVIGKAIKKYEKN
ncbi:Hypothetical predicted protein [Octopus vulgaris]|uniref:Uncharacterized protein n=1 Tax=Octopus vulgaris TaxID=6645 RepID=A0AA36BBB4_OCTVU|nr:Hypothetical predicted protein [Octopus vulgaris]